MGLGVQITGGRMLIGGPTGPIFPGTPPPAGAMTGIAGAGPFGPPGNTAAAIGERFGIPIAGPAGPT